MIFSLKFIKEGKMCRKLRMFPAVIAISVVCLTLSPLTIAKDKKIPQQEIKILKLLIT
jgi:hypothetical protein